MAPTPCKMAKAETGNHPGKLWTREERMFDEKFFFLNKSTTKYVITGLDARFFEPVVKICDRVTGSHITIKKQDFVAFTQIISSILNGTYKLERGFIEESTQLYGIKVYSVTNDIWKFIQADKNYASVLIHKSSLKVFSQVQQLILDRTMSADTTGYLSFIKQLRIITDTLEDPSTITEFLYERLATFTPGCIEYQVLFDLICNDELYSIVH